MKYPLLTKSFLMDVASKAQHLVEDERGYELLEAANIYHNIPARRPSLPPYQITPRYSYSLFEAAVLLGGRHPDGLSNEVECFRADKNTFTTLKQLPFKKRNEFAVCCIGIYIGFIFGVFCIVLRIVKIYIVP